MATDQIAAGTNRVPLTASDPIHRHAFDPDDRIPRRPGWHVWQSTRTRWPGILAGNGWDRILARVGGDITQTRGWMEYVLATGYQRAILVAGIDDAGEPRAAAVGYVEESRLPVVGFRTVRFPAYPTADEDLPLVEEATHVCERIARSHRCMTLEFLSGGQPAVLASFRPPGFRVRERLEYVIDLSRGRDELWTRVHKDQRRNVRFSHRQNVSVVHLETPESVRTLRDLQAEVNRRHAAKGDLYQLREIQSYDVLHRALIARGLARLYGAIVDGKMVMAALCSTYRGRARGIYNGANQRGLQVRATTAVIWRIMEELSLEGYRELSFGMADLDVVEPESPAHGLHEFKLDLGADLRRVPFLSKELRPTTVAAYRVLGRARSSLARTLGGFGQGSEPRP